MLLIDLLSRSELAAKRQPASSVSICGVYFLFDGNRIVYVGQSTNVLGRIGTHAQAGKKFDSFSYMEVEKDQLSEAELAYIQDFRPPLNRQFGLRSGKRRSLPLTDRGIRGLKPAERSIDYRDAHLHRGSGTLLLRVYPTGRKRWFFTYNIPTTEKRARGDKYPRCTIAGSEFPTAGLASARRWAAAFRAAIMSGVNPRDLSEDAAALRERLNERRAKR